MDELSNKIKIALEDLRFNQFANLENLRIESGPAVLNVIGWSDSTNFSSLTKAKSLQELNEVKSVFQKIMNHSLEFKEFVIGKALEYNLYFDDYGKASIRICTERNNTVEWSSYMK